MVQVLDSAMHTEDQVGVGVVNSWIQLVLDLVVVGTWGVKPSNESCLSLPLKQTNKQKPNLKSLKICQRQKHQMQNYFS